MKIKIDVNINTTKNLFNGEKQKELFGDLYNETNIPFINEKITPLFTGLFREYKDVIKNDSKNIIILGPSGIKI